MDLSVSVKSNLDNFQLNMSFETNSKRIGILGESGSGKSMLLKYIAGIFSPDEGKIMLNGEYILNSEEKINIKPQDRDVAYMFQNYALFPNMTVRENIEIVIEGSKEDKRTRANHLMNKFCIDNLSEKKPGELSGGQQQRVALARIMAYGPKVILLDEPFSALDGNLKEKMQVELEEMLNDYDGIVIMVSHSKTEIFKFSDEVLVINHGEIIEHGNTRELFMSPNTREGARMTGIRNILEASVDEDLVLHVPEWKLKIPLEEGFSTRENIKYIAVRGKFLKILEDDEKGENPINIEVESIYEDMEEFKVFFAIRGDDNNLLDESANVYSFRVKKDGKHKTLTKNTYLRLDFDKEKIIYIEN